MFCKHCSKKIDDDSRFCQFCGKKLSVDESENYFLVGPDNDYAITHRDGKYGLSTLDGKIIAEPIFDEVDCGENGYLYGLLEVVLDDKCGFIDRQGNIAIKCVYDDAYSFSDGLAAVRRNRLWGFINNKGDQIVDFKYDHVESFREGRANVQILIDGEVKFGQIDKNGTEFWD